MHSSQGALALAGKKDCEECTHSSLWPKITKEQKLKALACIEGTCIDTGGDFISGSSVTDCSVSNASWKSQASCLYTDK